MKTIARNTTTNPTVNVWTWRLSAASLTATGLLMSGGAFGEETLIERGEYLVRAGGCVSCHTADGEDAIPLAGGHELDTPFGTFYGPNITPDNETGIGDWSDEDFVNALWKGVSPKRKNYYPAFPYTSYTGISRDDVLAIKAYLFSLEPVTNINRKHKLRWYVSMRMTAGFWKTMGFKPARFEPDRSQSDEWNRGAYLVRHLGHCGECHTPRTGMGRVIKDRYLWGNADGGGDDDDDDENDDTASDITQNVEKGIGKWSSSEIELFLEIGMLPDGDFTGGSMSAVIDDNTSILTAEDRSAIAVYLKSISPSGPL